MQNAIDLITQLGQIAMLVIVVWVAIMLVISFFDRHPRASSSGNDISRKKTNPGDAKKRP